MFSLPFMVLLIEPDNDAAQIARAIKAALVLAGHNEKTAASEMGLSISQVSRLIASGTLDRKFRKLGPEFARNLLPLLAEVYGVEPVRYEARRTA